MVLSLELSGILWWNFASILTRCSPRDCEMTFISGRGFAELQILKKWKWSYLLNWVEYCDEILHTHRYWQDVAQEIVKCHLGLAEVLPRFKFWKKWNWPYLLNLLVYFDKILHTHYSWHDQDRGIAKSNPRDCEMTFDVGRGLPSSKFLKSENGRTEWNIVMHPHWCWQDVAQEIFKCHLGLAEGLPRVCIHITIDVS